MSKCNDYPINNIDAEERICIVDGCYKLAKARGLCSGHLHKLQRYGVADLPNRKEQDGRMNHPLYRTWKGMRARCNNPNFKQFADYGGRGIEVCERWNNVNDGFWNFVEDMGERPDGYTLDRIDPDGDYCPENCVWSDRLTQNNNTRRTKYAEQLAIEDPDSVEIYPAIIISTPDGDRTIKFNSLDDMLSRLERLKYV